MYIVTNIIRVKKGYAGKLVERFKVRKGIETFPGFVRLDLLITDKQKDFDEVRVYTTWENKESFEGWFHSDIFLNAHKNRKQHEYVIGNTVTFHELAYSYIKAEADQKTLENV